MYNADFGYRNQKIYFTFEAKELVLYLLSEMFSLLNAKIDILFITIFNIISVE